jgi:Fe-S-cluster-containing hydrogenase component 2
MDINHVGDHECINCGECIPVCPTKAITWKGSKIFVKATTPVSMPVPQTESVNLTSFVKPVNAQAEEAAQENTKQEQVKDEVKDEREI